MTHTYKAIFFWLFAIIITTWAHQADAKPPVVELFTSVHCPNCPFAEKSLAAFSAKDNIFALNYHVDISNGRKKEPYATENTEARGWFYQKNRGKSFLATPLMIGQGESALSGSKIFYLPAFIEHLNAPEEQIVTLHKKQNTLIVALPKARLTPKDIWLVTYTPIQRHKNHASPSNIVRTIERLAFWDGHTEKYFKLSKFTKETGSHVAILVQEPQGGKIIDYVTEKRP